MDIGEAEVVGKLGEKASQSASSWKIVARPLPRLVTWYRASGKSMRGGRGMAGF